MSMWNSIKVFIEAPETERILQLRTRSQLLARQAGFNVWSIVSMKAHYENFHSDIIAALLDPEGAHTEDGLFLRLFIDYLNKHCGQQLSASDFEHAHVGRENDRVDILIADQKSRKAVIIENKMNNAVDQDKQLEGYFRSVEGRAFEVVAIIYLSLDGSKIAPSLPKDIKVPVCNIGAFKDHPSDLVSGWLAVCEERAQQHQSRSFLNQYSALIKSLASMSFDSSTHQNFYKYLSEQPQNIKAVEALLALRNEQPAYRAKLFLEGIKDHKPFEILTPYRPNNLNVVIFENWRQAELNWKLELTFDHTQIIVGFWNPEGEMPKSQAVRDKLNLVQMLGDFPEEQPRGNGLQRTFKLGQEGEPQTLEQLDAAALELVERLLAALRETAE